MAFLKVQSGRSLSKKAASGIVDNADATAITIDSSENVGIGGVTPKTAWRSNCKAMQIGTQSALWESGTDNTLFSQNVYEHTDSDRKYINTGEASYYYQYNGGHYWETFASGSGDAVLSTASGTMTFNGGAVGIGTAGNALDATRLEVKSNGGGSEKAFIVKDVNNNQVLVQTGGGTAWFSYGPVGINTVTPDTATKLDVNGVIKGSQAGKQFNIGGCVWYGAVNAGTTNQAFTVSGSKKCGWMQSLGTENNRNSGFRMYGYLWNSINGMSMSERFNMTQGNAYGNGWIDVSGANIRYRAHSSWHNNAYVKMTTIMGD